MIEIKEMPIEAILYDPGSKEKYIEVSTWLREHKIAWDHYGSRFGLWYISIYFTDKEKQILFGLKFL